MMVRGCYYDLIDATCERLARATRSAKKKEKAKTKKQMSNRRSLRKSVLGGSTTSVIALATLTSLVIGSTSAWAQTPPRQPNLPRNPPKWSFEFYVGKIGESQGTGSGISQFPTGPSFTTQDSGNPSRAVPSWYFGDGAALFNEVAADFAARYGQNYTRITPLDEVLTSAAARRKGGTTFGFRLTGWLATRVGLEIGFDRSDDPLGLTDAAESAIAATRTSFQNGFTGLLGAAPVSGTTVTSTAQVPADAVGEQMSFTLGVSVAVVKTSRVRVITTFGAGAVSNKATALTAQLNGNYRFSMFGLNPINETDSVTVRFSDKDLVPIAIAGAGVSIDLGRRHGFRVEARARANQNETRISVDAAPSMIAVAPLIYFSTATSPSLQFSTTAGIPTSLGGEPISGLETFKGSGIDIRTVITVGYYVRF